VRLALLGSRGSSKGSGSEDQIITPLGVGSLNSSPESKRFIDSRRYFLSIPPIPPAHFVFRIYILVFFWQFCLWWPRFVRTLHWGYSIIRCQESGRGQNCNLANGKFVYLLACLPVFCRQKSRNISGCKLLVHWSSNLPLGLIEPLWQTAGHN